MVQWFLRLLGVDQPPDPGPNIQPPKPVPGMEKPDGRERMYNPRIPRHSDVPFAVPNCQFHSDVRSVTCCEICFVPLCERCLFNHHHPSSDYDGDLPIFRDA